MVCRACFLFWAQATSSCKIKIKHESPAPPPNTLGEGGWTINQKIPAMPSYTSFFSTCSVGTLLAYVCRYSSCKKSTCDVNGCIPWLLRPGWNQLHMSCLMFASRGLLHSHDKRSCTCATTVTSRGYYGQNESSCTCYQCCLSWMYQDEGSSTCGTHGCIPWLLQPGWKSSCTCGIKGCISWLPQTREELLSSTFS